MNNRRNYDDTTEENFLKNKAKRKKLASTNRSKSRTVTSSKSVSNKTKAVREKKPASTSTQTSGTSKKVFKIIGIVLIAVIASIIAAGLGFLIYTVTLDDSVDIKGSLISGDSNADKRVSAQDASNKDDDVIDIGNFKFYTFLATATDASGNLTDVIMVARFHYPDDDNFTEPEVSVLQIPRDTYVRMASTLYFNEDGTLSKKNFDPKTGTYATKINSAYSHGRNLGSSYITTLLKETAGLEKEEIEAICQSKDYKFLNADVEKIVKYHKAKESDKKEIKANMTKDFGITYLATLIYHYFGIPIDYQAQVNIAGFRGIVDAIGGVDLEVPQRMYYKDPYQDLYIDLQPGYQHLNGKKAEEFVRFRSYVRGDVDRLDAQKIFINAFLDKLISPGIVTKIDKITVEIQNNLYTGISFNDLLRFSRKVLKMDPEKDFALHTLPGVGDYVGNVSYFIAYREESVALINEQFNVYDEPYSESDLLMIDYNDVTGKQKPAISTSSNSKPKQSKNENSDSDEEESSSEQTDTENTENDEPVRGNEVSTPVTVERNESSSNTSGNNSEVSESQNNESTESDSTVEEDSLEQTTEDTAAEVIPEENNTVTEQPSDYTEEAPVQEETEELIPQPESAETVIPEEPTVIPEQPETITIPSDNPGEQINVDMPTI